MTGPPVLASGTWRTNADMIVDVARLGYLNGRILDPTPGDNAGWFAKWQPAELITSRTDFRTLHHADGEFDAAAYDPPYVCPGGRETSGLQAMYAHYGLLDTPRTPQLLQTTVIEPGLTEMARVVRPGGYILAKCQDYVWSGRLQAGTYWTQRYATEVLELETCERFEHVTRPRPQPALNPDGTPRRQVHARRNLSTLFVFRVTSRSVRRVEDVA